MYADNNHHVKKRWHWPPKIRADYLLSYINYEYVTENYINDHEAVRKMLIDNINDKILE